MEKFIVLFVLISPVVNSPPSVTKHYRTDYVYNRRTDAFYKVHTESVRRSEMSSMCPIEGAAPVASNSNQDIAQIHGMMKQYPELGEYVWVAEDGQDHESAEEQPVIDLSSESDEGDTHNCEVLTREGQVKLTFCHEKLPFVCKVEARNAPYDQQCQVFGKGYQFFPSVGSCYKIPQVPLTWNQAYAECKAEGAHLVVINSETEREVVKNLTNTEKSVIGATTSYFYFAGFRAEKTIGDTPRIFKTIFNQTLDEAGFTQWSDNEPNNAGEQEYCGTIFKKDGLYNDVDCKLKFGFICEKEVS